MKKAIIYTRVSTEDQADNGYSLRDQEERLRRYCEIKQIEVVEHFQDNQSAKSFNRTNFQGAVEFVRKNKRKIDYLLFVKWDRFSRNITEAYKMLETLGGLGIESNAIEQPLDLRVPENKLLLAIYLATPEIENDRRSLNTKAGMRKALKEGRWVSAPPKGYKMGRDGQNRPLMYANDDAKFVIEGYHLYSTGLYSKCEVRKILEKKGLKISKNQWLATLRNPLYYGKIFIPEWREEEELLVDGLHEALVSEEIYNRCQQVEFSMKKNMPKPNAKNEELPLRGHLLCKQCGSALTGSGSMGNGGKYFYYHCQHGCKERFRADVAHVGFEKVLGGMEIKEEVASLYMAVMEDIFKTEEGDRQQEIKKLDTQVTDFKSKLVKTDDMFISGDLEKDSYKRMKDHYHQQIWALQERKKEMQSMDSGFDSYMKYGFSLLMNVPKYYHSSNHEIKQKIVGSIFPEKLVFEDGAYRTNRVNEVLSLICTSIKGLRGYENKMVGKKTDHHYVAPRVGLEPTTL